MIAQGTYTVQEIQSSANEYFKDTDKEKGSGYKQWKRWEYDAIRMKDDDGFLAPASHYYKELARYNNFLNKKGSRRSGTCSGDWKPLGPTEIVGWASHDPGIGRITSIAIDPNNAKSYNCRLTNWWYMANERCRKDMGTTY